MDTIDSTLRHPFRRWVRLLSWVALGYSFIGVAQAQQINPGAKHELIKDSLSTTYSQSVADSLLMGRDSLFYSKLKQRLYKHRLTRQLYDALIRDVYNSQKKTGEVSQIEVDPFQAYAGKIIGAIYIRRLNVFGQSVYDTLRRPGNWIERTGNKFHTNTREGTIRQSYLLFDVGDEVKPTQLRDNERLLRNVGIFHDARILIVPRENSRQFVDAYVITQDIWSLLPTGGAGGLNNFNVGFEQRNVRGLGHQFTNLFAYDGNNPYQKAEYRARYVIPYIGKTFLTAQADLLYLRDQKQLGLKVFRSFLTPDTKYAGSIEFSYYRLRNRVLLPTDSSLIFPLNYGYSDVWLGRSFKAPFGSEQTRGRIVVAGRITRYTFSERPAIRPDTNQLYQNSRLTLFSLGYSQRRYVRDVLIYGFGRTEDVPYGNLLAFIGGVDYAELGPRSYAGLNFSRGQYYRKLGYLYVNMGVGSYYQAGAAQQGLLSVETNYFSPLLKNKWGNMRHFLNFRLTQGIDRFNNEYLKLGGSDQLGVNNDALIGTKRLLVSYQNVLFSKVNFIGFRIAFITFANLGMVSFPERSLLRSSLYQGYGFGFRLRNENLTFNSFQIRLAYYPNLPNNPQAIRYAFEGVPTVRFRDFDISAPQIVQYQ